MSKGKILSKSIADMIKEIKQSRGAYEAKRLERAADEVPNLERLYQKDALEGLFRGENARGIMTMRPGDFERYAVPLGIKSSVGPKAAELARSGDISKGTVTTDEYIKHLQGIRGGFNEVPYLHVNKEEAGLPLLPYIAGHEGRHRMRALAGKGQPSALVSFEPRAELREPFPRRSREEYIEAIKQELGLTDNMVTPEFDGSIIRPDIELPDVYRAGGAVRKADGGIMDAIEAAKMAGKPRAAIPFNQTVDVEQMRREVEENARRVAQVKEGLEQDRLSRLPPAEMKAYDPSPRQQVGAAVQKGFSSLGAPISRARELSNVLTGGTTGGMSAIDVTPIGAAFLGQEGIERVAQNVGEGNYGTAALEAGLTALDVLPGSAAARAMMKPAASAARKSLNPAAKSLEDLRYETAQEGPFYRVRPRGYEQSGYLPYGTKEAPGKGSGVVGRPEGSIVPKLIPDEQVDELISQPDNFVRQSVDQYSQEKFGRPYEMPQMPESSLLKQGPIGRAFELAATDNPQYKAAVFDAYAREMPDVVQQAGAKSYDELMARSYEQLAKETEDQFKRLPLNLSYHRAGEGDYDSSKDLLKDIYGNKHMYVYQGGDPHDFLNKVDPGTGLNTNEMFRAVHDFYGHALHGNQFGPKGEEIAWGTHSQTFSPLARLAMSSETRGQNSFVNYTPINAPLKKQIAEFDDEIAQSKRMGDKNSVDELQAEKKRLLKSAFQFAPQKSVLLPPEFLKLDYNGGMPDYLQPMIKPAPETATSMPLTHFSFDPNLSATDPSKFGEGAAGREVARLKGAKGAVGERTYFYPGEPGAVERETQVGPYRYRGEASSLYDVSKDPMNLGVLARESNRSPFASNVNPGMVYQGEAMTDLERLAKEYGYEGIFNPNVNPPMAMTYGSMPVQRQKNGGRVSMDAMRLAVGGMAGGGRSGAVKNVFKSLLGRSDPTGPLSARRGLDEAGGNTIIKEGGGNWMAGEVERGLSGLKRKELSLEDMALARSRITKYKGGNPDVTAGQIRRLDEYERDALTNKLIDKQIANYVKNQMGTKDDPIRLAADAFPAQKAKLLADKQVQIDKATADMEKARQSRGFTPEMMTRSQARIRALEKERELIERREGLHIKPHEYYGLSQSRLMQRRMDAGMPVQSFGQTENARNWEDIVDRKIDVSKAKDWTEGSLYPEPLASNPWLNKVDPESKVYSPRDLEHDFGFDHMMDEMRNATNIESGLPKELLIDPKNLSKWTMPQVSEHVDKINAWRASQKAEADLVSANNAATVLHKDYPEKGMKWVELKMPEKAPEGWVDDVTKGGKADLDPNYAYGQKTLSDALKYEADQMTNCVGGYCSKVMDGESRIYSLRDAKGNPHATVEVNPGKTWAEKSGVFYDNPELEPSWKKFSDESMVAFNAKGLPQPMNYILQYPEWLKANDPEMFAKYANVFDASPPNIKQIKGKNNAAPSEEYLPYVQDFVRSGNYGDVKDLQNTGLYKTNSENKFDRDVLPTMSGNARQLAYGRASAAGEIQPYMTKSELEEVMKKHAPEDIWSSPGQPMTEADITGQWEPEGGMKRGGRVRKPISIDAMRLAVGGMAEGGAATSNEAMLRRARRLGKVDKPVSISPLQLARGWAAGTTGLPGDIESLGRMLIPGVSEETFLPTSEEMLKKIPGAADDEVGQRAAQFGTLFGGAGVGTGAKAAMKGARAIAPELRGSIGDSALDYMFRSGMALPAAPLPAYSPKILESTTAKFADKIADVNPKLTDAEVQKKALAQAIKKLEWERVQKPALEKKYGALGKASFADSNPNKMQNTAEVVAERKRKANDFLDQPTEPWTPPRKELQAFDRSSIKDALEGFPGVEQSSFPRDTPTRASTSHVEELYGDPENRALITKQIKRGLPLGGETFYGSLYPVKQASLDAGMSADKFDKWVHSIAPASARNSIMNEMAVGQFMRNMNARGIPLTEVNVAKEMALYKEKFGIGLPLMPIHRQGVQSVLEGGQNLREMNKANIPTNYKIPTYGSQKAGDFAKSVTLDVHEAAGQTQGSRYHPYFKEQGGFGNTEYNVGEQGLLGIAGELGLPGGMAQAGRWFGGGELTGLKSPRGDALDLLEKQVAYTLKQKGVQPNPANVRAEILKQIETGEGDLLPWYRKEGMPDVRETGLQRAEGGRVSLDAMRLSTLNKQRNSKYG